MNMAAGAINSSMKPGTSHILSINGGSSSIKFALFETGDPLRCILGGLDTLVFVGGIGENAPLVRFRVCNGLGFLGIELDEKQNVASEGRYFRNNRQGHGRVICTDEEFMIARLVHCVLKFGQ